jgi:hypothetical protein
MKHTHIVTIAAGLFLCLGSLRAQESNTNNLSGRLMTTFGEVSRSDSPWMVRVSDADRKIQISYNFKTFAGSGTVTVSPSDWRAQPGWFVFVENSERAWAYDGDKSLLLQVEKPAKLGPKGTHYGPNTFPCPVPTEVLARLTPEAQKGIKK